MKALNDLSNWFRECLWDWAVDHAYDAIIGILVMSVLVVVAQIINFNGGIVPSSIDDSENLLEIKSSINTIVYCVGIIGDMTFLFSLSAIIARFFRDLSK
jgi:uncharacterized membrane protein